MFAQSVKRATSSDLLRHVLLGYLLDGWVTAWPGADGQTVDDILNCYPEAMAYGAVPDWEELGRRHKDLIGAIQSLVSVNGWLTSRVSP